MQVRRGASEKLLKNEVNRRKEFFWYAHQVPLYQPFYLLYSCWDISLALYSHQRLKEIVESNLACLRKISSGQCKKRSALLPDHLRYRPVCIVPGLYVYFAGGFCRLT